MALSCSARNKLETQWPPRLLARWMPIISQQSRSLDWTFSKSSKYNKQIFRRLGLRNCSSHLCYLYCLSPTFFTLLIQFVMLQLSVNQNHICCTGTIVRLEEAQVLSAGCLLHTAHLTYLTTFHVPIMTWQAGSNLGVTSSVSVESKLHVK